MNIIIFDISKNYIKKAKELEKYGIKVINSNIIDLINNNSISALVCPSNIYGDLKGGILDVYKILFPNVKTNIDNKINSFKIISENNLSILPIGSSVTLVTEINKCPFLIFSSIFEEKNFKKKNIFFYFISILYLSKQNTNNIIACPGISTSFNNISVDEEIKQIMLAIKYYNMISTNDVYLNNIKFIDGLNLVMNESIINLIN